MLELFDERQADRRRLVNLLDEAVEELATRLANKPPQAMRLGLEAFYAQSDMDYAAALPFLQDKLFACFSTDEPAEGMSAFFEKRAPKWQQEE